MAQKHIAASGVSAGKWVACTAKIQCRNGGLHVDSADIAKVAKVLGKRVSDVTLEDVQEPRIAASSAPLPPPNRPKSNVFLQPENPTELPEHFSPHSELTKSVHNPSIPMEDTITVEYYENELKEIVSIMKQDPRWEQAEKEAQSIMDKMRVKENLIKGHGMFSSEYGDFMVGDFTINASSSHNIVDLLTASWTMGSSMDNGLKIAFGHALHDEFGMGKSDFKAGYKSQELYSQNRTFFKVAVDSIYKNTQSKLTEKTYRLARLTDKGTLRPLSSFTGLKKVISDFHSDNAGYTNENTVVLYADVPKERIFGYYGTSFGTAYQSEFVVLGAGRKLPPLENYASVKMPAPEKPRVSSRVPAPKMTPAPSVPPKKIIDLRDKATIVPVEDKAPKKKGFLARIFGW